ncbi:MAG: hypothetical protein M1824_000240 [Vezdaea acicularis]|nr:MAG: hypothetical protein M1824_000240 [Vezdaea acicularis]
MNLNLEIDALLATGAFDDVQSNSGQRQEVRRRLIRWRHNAKDIETIISPITYKDLKKTWRKKEHFELDPSQLPKFTRITSSNIHHQIIDTHGNLLVYRYQIPMSFVDKLLETTNSLPPVKPVEGRHPRFASSDLSPILPYLVLPRPSTITAPSLRLQVLESLGVSSHAYRPSLLDEALACPYTRGSFMVRHYAAWADYMPEPKSSKEYRDQLPYSKEFLDNNQSLFNRLSDDLRLIYPTMYTKYKSVQKFYPEGVRSLAGVWHGIAVNQGQDDAEGTGTHQDWQDYYYGFNTVLPYGTYTGGALILWQLGVIYELQPGDVIMFFGALIAHNTEGVTAGERNSVDLFVHKSTLDWKKRLMTGKQVFSK